MMGLNKIGVSEQNEVNVIQVKFLKNLDNVGAGEKRYNYYNSRVEVEFGDTVVVSTRYGHALARVVGFDKAVVAGNNEAEILTVIEGVKEFDEFKDAMRKRRLEKELEKRIAELDTKLKYKMYAEQDEDFRKIYEELYGKLD